MVIGTVKMALTRLSVQKRVDVDQIVLSVATALVST